MNILLVNNDSDTWSKLVDAVKQTGHYVTPIHHSEINTADLNDFDVAILSGGWWYDDEAELRASYAQELELIRNSNLPILGICIGMQLMHVSRDGKVPLLDEPQSGDRTIEILPEGQQLLGLPSSVTVFKNHTRGIKEVDADFRALAVSPGHVEIMLHRTRPLLGVQYHPEMGPLDEAAERISALLQVLVGDQHDAAVKTPSKKPLIGITSGVIYNKERPYSPHVYGQMHTYVESISRAGAIPVILPILQDKSEIRELFDHLDGVMFAGGNDIDPRHYGQENRASTDIDTVRDAHELELMRLALATHLPILAICRGMQLLNIARGGTLYQELTDEVPAASNHDGYLDVKSTEHLAHTLRIVPDTHLSQLLGSTIRTNTHHHQAVHRIGGGLIANAYAEDGVIEGIEDMRHGFVMGVQSHPESIVGSVQPEWAPVFRAFIEAAK